MVVETIFVSVWAVAGATLVGSLLQLNAFLRDTPAIEDEACLARFKALARTQMYLALLMIVLTPLVFILSAVLVAIHGLTGGVAVLAVSAVFGGFALYVRRIEAKTRNLQAASEALEQEYRRVCNSWLQKALPDF